MAFALKPRKFYLPPPTVQRLGGPRAAAVMQLLVDEKLSQAAIMERLEMGAAEYDALTLAHAFKRELKSQLKLREHDEKFRKQNREAAKALRESKGVAVAPGTPSVPFPELPQVQLARGQTPTEWVLKRINEVTPQAVQRLVWLMENARQEQVQYNAATKLLGLNGIVEVEKSISVIADAEAIIRELNKRGPYRKPVASPEDTIDINDPIADAEFTEVQDAESPGDSGAGTEPPSPL